MKEKELEQALQDIEEYIEDNCKDYFENESKPSYIIDDKQTRYILEIINKALGEDKL